MKRILLASALAFGLAAPAAAFDARGTFGVGGTIGNNSTTQFERGNYSLNARGVTAGVQGGSFVDGATGQWGGAASVNAGTIGTAQAVRTGNTFANATFNSNSAGNAVSSGNSVTSFEAGTNGSAEATRMRVRENIRSFSSTTTGSGLTVAGSGRLSFGN